MSLLHIGILALIQGITEFLPVSSSGHLILVPILTSWPDQGQVMDVAVHVGTAGAVILYFWRDLWAMIAGLFRLMNGQRDPGARLAGLLVVGTVPAVVVGLAMNVYVGEGLRSLVVVAWTLPIFAVVLYVTDRMGMTVRRIEHLGLSDAVVIGCAQALALVPGTSRSGITISAARVLGLERSEAARFSMLLSIPAILGAGTLKAVEVFDTVDPAFGADIAIATGLAFLAGLLAIAVLMAWIKRGTFTPFVVYRLLLGAVLLALAYGLPGGTL